MRLQWMPLPVWDFHTSVHLFSLIPHSRYFDKFTLKIQTHVATLRAILLAKCTISLCVHHCNLLCTILQKYNVAVQFKSLLMQMLLPNVLKYHGCDPTSKTNCTHMDCAQYIADNIIARSVCPPLQKQDHMVLNKFGHNICRGRHTLQLSCQQYCIQQFIPLPKKIQRIDWLRAVVFQLYFAYSL